MYGSLCLVGPEIIFGQQDNQFAGEASCEDSLYLASRYSPLVASPDMRVPYASQRMEQHAHKPRGYRTGTSIANGLCYLADNRAHSEAPHANIGVTRKTAQLAHKSRQLENVQVPTTVTASATIRRDSDKLNTERTGHAMVAPLLIAQCGHLTLIL